MADCAEKSKRQRRNSGQRSVGQEQRKQTARQRLRETVDATTANATKLPQWVTQNVKTARAEHANATAMPVCLGRLTVQQGSNLLTVRNQISK
jgi:predicted Holliday junction resolvase-like endonuclease